MESWIFKVIINKSAAKFATGKNSKNLLNALGLENWKWKFGNMEIWKYGNMEIWKYGNMESSHSSRSFNSSLVLTLPGMSEIYLLEKSSCASCYILES